MIGSSHECMNARDHLWQAESGDVLSMYEEQVNASALDPVLCRRSAVVPPEICFSFNVPHAVQAALAGRVVFV